VSVLPVKGGLPADIAAIIAEELAALAIDAHTLSSRLAAGDVVDAVVLPSNGLTDLLSIGGLRVAAELPPSLLPGETITVMVIGFSNDRINLRIIPTPEAAAEQLPAAAAAGHAARTASAPAVTVSSAPGLAPPDSRAPGSAALGSAAPGSTNPGANNAPSPSGLPRPYPAPQGSPARTNWTAAGGAPAHETAAAAVFRGPIPVPAAPVPPASKTIEARLAAAHAMTPPGPRAPIPPPAPGSSPLVARPPIAMRPPLMPSAGLPAAAIPVSATRAPVGFNEPGALLRGLNVPVTAANLAAARTALAAAPDRLPAALAALEGALANDADPRVATLATLTSFIARLDPRSPVLGAQIAAFADHVVIGPEAKIAQLVKASDPALLAAGGPAEPPGRPAPESVAIVRAALDYDLKTQLLALAADRARDPAAATVKSTTLDRAVVGVLTAITALQLNAAAALRANPDGVAFSLPVALPDGVVQARIRIDRDAPAGRTGVLDDDNFHIAFVLETRHLGTVAIDMLTVGRAVTLSVKTEAALAQRVFSRALGKLTARLETLRYRVANAAAVVAPPPALAVEPGPPAAKPQSVVFPADAQPAHRVDFDA
jgi:hypothetical protein